MARHLRLPGLLALPLVSALHSWPAWAQIVENESERARPLSAWIAVPVGVGLFLLAIYVCSRLIRRDECAERQWRGEAGDKPVTPVPGGDGGHHFH